MSRGAALPFLTPTLEGSEWSSSLIFSFTTKQELSVTTLEETGWAVQHRVCFLVPVN
jgi:hypothetical protein